MRNSETEILAAAYDAGAQEEYERLSSTTAGKNEFNAVCRIIEKHTKPGSVIYDIGCGPGRYAEYLLSKGFRLGCVDLSPKSIQLFRNRINTTDSANLLFNKVSCATELDWIDSSSAETILLMGPMYHLTKSELRKKVIENCYRVLKKDGMLISMYMSPFPVLHPQLKVKNKILHLQQRSGYYISYTHFRGYTVPQFRCWPPDAVAEIEKYFTEEETLNIDDPPVELKAGAPDFPLIKQVLSGCTGENKPGHAHQYLVVYSRKL
jgi:SAM-dependent methyltransferase